MADCVPGKVIEKGKFTDEKSSKENDASLLCDPCTEDGNYKVAVGFCVNCQHYLCDNCFQYHRIPRPMKEHRLMNKQEMPKKKVKSLFSEVCQMHEGEAVKYYCPKHEAIGCNTCMLIDHKPCQAIRVLADVAKDAEYSQLYTNFHDWINRTEAILKVQLDTADDNIRTSNTCSGDVLESIDTLEKKIIERFHIMRTKVAQEANEIADRDAKRIKVLKDSVTAAKENIDDMKNDIEILKSTNQNKHLFIALKKALKQQGKLNEILDDIKDKNKVQKYEFVENGLLTNMMANIDEIGEIFFHDGEINTPVLAVNYPEYGIPKCVPISTNSYLMADHVCNRLCLFKDGKFVWEHKLTSGPWDITVVADGIIAITLPNERNVKVISISDLQCKETQSITLNARCEGIVCAEGCLYVACSKPAKVLVLDMDGQVKKSIETSETGHPLFEQTAYITCNSEKQVICVSDRRKSSITVLSLDGDIKEVYETTLNMPLFMTFDKDSLTVLDPLSKGIWSINLDTRETGTSIFDEEDGDSTLQSSLLSLGYGKLYGTSFTSFSLSFIAFSDTEDDSSDEDSSVVDSAEDENTSDDNALKPNPFNKSTGAKNIKKTPKRNLEQQNQRKQRERARFWHH